MILGPTGTGKTALGIAVARAIDGEVVGCDALQIYRGLDAGTAKPSAEERAAVPHHVVDCVDVASEFSVARYVDLADRAIADIRSRGRVPIVVGGTGMYLRALLRGLVAAPARDEAFRRRVLAAAARRGTAGLHRALARRDPESAARIPPGDRQRIARALELARRGGRTLSERLERGTWDPSTPERYAASKYGLDYRPERRAALGERLDRRVARFFDDGLVEEVRDLVARDAEGALASSALKAIGYREVARALRAGADPRTALEEVRRNTRRLVKRQRTWFRREPGVRWLDAERPVEESAATIVAAWEA